MRWMRCFGLVAFVAGCGGREVALNERLFALPSMESAGAGCTLYELGSGKQSTGTSAAGLDVAQALQGDQVVVSVSEAGRSIVERKYGEGFFASGLPDDFTATSSTGDQLLLRYWGKVDPGGTSGCASLDDNGNR